MRQPEVSIPQGSYRGVRGAAGCAFLGIPYAAPAVGELRFAAPRPPVPSAGLQDATRYGPTVPAPPQRSAAIAELLPDPVIPGDAALNLNVWTPDPAGRAPVLVWLHGGGFVTGTGAVTAFDGTAFARDGVVVVVVNYRLAAEGFLALPGAVPNRGLLDQVAALRWVRDNIGAFGGDPDRVTLAGESAGAMSALTLLAVPAARGLFSRVIAQSGDAHHVHTAEEADLVAAEVTRELGAESSVTAFAAADPRAAHLALNAVIDRVSAGVGDPWGRFRRLVVQPVVDGEVLPEHPAGAIADGAGADVDLLIGGNTDEYGLFTFPTGLADRLGAALLRDLVGRLGVDPDATVARYRDLLPGADPADLYVAIQGDWFCRVPARRVLDARAGARARTHAYEFAWRPPTFGGRLGACHTLEVPFVFDTLGDPWGRRLRGDSAPQSLADEVHGAWVRFVVSGDPGWAAYGRDRVVRRLDLESRSEPDRTSERLPAWAGVI